MSSGVRMNCQQSVILIPFYFLKTFFFFFLRSCITATFRTRFSRPSTCLEFKWQQIIVDWLRRVANHVEDGSGSRVCALKYHKGLISISAKVFFFFFLPNMGPLNHSPVSEVWLCNNSNAWVKLPHMDTPTCFNRLGSFFFYFYV